MAAVNGVTAQMKVADINSNLVTSLPRHVSASELQDVADQLMRRVRAQPNLADYSPTVCIVLGSGLGGLAKHVTDTFAVNYKEIPYFPVSTVVGHAGELVMGKLGGKHVVCMKGRVHYYEGYPPQTLAVPIRVMRSMGAKTLLVTSAVGAMKPEYSVGDFMVVRDHINLPQFAGLSPLVGANDPAIGPRFIPTNKAYDLELRRLALSIAKEKGFDFVRQGILASQVGPCYETVAELRMLCNFADCVGMSMVAEVISALHAGMKCFGMALVTNKCVMDFDSDDVPNHEEVMAAGKAREPALEDFFTTFVERM